jgi:hypothetical protein
MRHKLLTLLLLFVGALSTNAGVNINSTNFPDNNFRSHVKNYDINSNGKVDISDVNAVINIMLGK